jgi:hypothetical protein
MKIALNDFGSGIELTIKNADGSAKDLTDYNVHLKVWKTGSPGNPLVNGDCTVATPATGVAVYTIVDLDFDEPGRFKAEVELTKAGVRESTEAFDIEVVESA